MRRDMEYCIEILKDLSEGTFKKILYVSHIFTPELSAEEEEENKKYMYHLEIMRDAGLIDYELMGISGGYNIVDCPIITWQGNDFLDMVENESLWNRTKESVKAKGFEIAKMPIDLLVSYTKMKAKEMLGLEIE